MMNLKFMAALRVLRPYQWAKNALALVGLILSHQWDDPIAVWMAAVSLIALCLASSSVYVLNDLIDVEDDRRHDRNRSRPIASGELSTHAAAWLVPLLLALAYACARVLPWDAQLIIASYVLAAAGYSLLFKRMLWIDVVVLAGLYTARVLCGVVAVGAPISPWLIAFSAFVFTGLAILKRYADLRFDSERLHGRPYMVSDRFLLLAVGIAVSLLSVLVLALYVNSDDVAALYARPWAIAFICPIIAVWLLRLWTLADRKQLAIDPVLYALRDPASYVSLVACAAAFAVAL